MLIAAPTGSGKTLTAFLWAIDRLLRDAEANRLTDTLRVVYVSPLRALSNDMHRNLEVPLAEITALAHEQGLLIPEIRAGLRTGDTPQAKRAALIKRPPHILVTTPESLYLLLTSARGRERLGGVETVIVDEIHSLVRDKRGSHLGLTLERLSALCPSPPQRVGLSATQKPIERIGEFLVGAGSDRRPLSIVDGGHQRDLDLAIETPLSELGAACMHEQWAEIIARVCELINTHRSTLIFVNTRRMAERVAHQLTEALGPDAVSSHHGSLAAELRLDTEQRLKTGKLKAVVATASLELGLDIGYIDLVIQLGSPQAIATFLQRVGRSGHALGLTPKGRLFALTRDELIECMALIRAIRAGRLDVVPIPDAPLDVLAQQITAEVAANEWCVDDLYDLCRRAYSYRNLPREEFEGVLNLLSEGITSGTGRSRQHLHYDRVGRRLRGRPGARISAVQNGGAIPEIASYRVVAAPEHTVVGTLDEDFASESQAGEIFLLGNTSWRIQHVRGNDVTVSDAQGAPPSIPFWRGEAPGRTLELSEEVSRLREDIARCSTGAGEPHEGVPLAACPPVRERDPACTGGQAASGTQSALDAERRSPGLPDGPAPATQASVSDWLMSECAVSKPAAKQAADYIAAQQAAIGVVPTQKQIVFERFFDESGGMQLVIHAPFGARICKAWGLALRKRFCRSFDFELQANADDDGVVLSLGPQHSFPLESMFHMLNAQNIQPLLQQALLFVPTFQTRWRWNVIRALQVMKFRNGKKVPPNLLRMKSDDLLTAVFPKLTGCQENVTGDLELPDHPLCRQSMHDSLTEPCDLDGLRRVMERIAAGEIELIARDTREPSPFSYELLNANPYAFLDGGEVAERRARAVATRRSLTVESVSDLGRLDPAAIEQVRREAQPLVRSADELHDVLLSRVILPEDELQPEWRPWLEELIRAGRATQVRGTGFQPVRGFAQVENLCYEPAPSGATGGLPASENASSHSARADKAPVAPGWSAVATERWPAASAVYPEAQPNPAINVPEGIKTDWTPEDARVAMTRGLIEVSGPITAAGVAERLGFTESQAEASLMYLEGEGVVLRGRFEEAAAAPAELPPDPPFVREEAEDPIPTPVIRGVVPLQFCHRRLLSRIHRLTIEGLRKQIEPVTVDVYMRFLFRHHGLVDGTKRSGTNGLFEAVSMLQGLDAPAVSWERDLLAARLDRYRPEWLDELCLNGEVGWGRLFPPRRTTDRARLNGVTRAVPVSLFLRDDCVWLTPPKNEGLEDALPTLTPSAARVLRMLQRNGAMFAADLLADTGLWPTQLNDALGELVAHGLLTADGFAGLRNLLAEKSNEDRSPADRARRGALRRRAPLAGSGRWSIWTRGKRNECPEEAGRVENPSHSACEEWAWQLLRRWGVVFRDLLDREDGAPRWFELLQVYRRLEARGEIRGGRFITGVAGEQFALGDTVKRLRHLRDQPPPEEVLDLCAADPLNVVGILTPHGRVPRTASNRILWRDGQPLAARIAGDVRMLAEPRADVLQTLARHGWQPGQAQVPSESSDEEAEPVSVPAVQPALFR